MAWDLGGLGGWDSGPWSWAFGTWKLGPGTWDFGSWNLDPGTLDLGLGTWDLGFVWDLGFGTWDSRPVMCPPKLRKPDVCVLSESPFLPLPECSQMASRCSPELLCDTSYSSKKLLCTMHLHTHVLLLAVAMRLADGSLSGLSYRQEDIRHNLGSLNLAAADDAAAHEEEAVYFRDTAVVVPASLTSERPRFFRMFQTNCCAFV